VVDEGFDALNDQILGALDSGFQSLQQILDENETKLAGQVDAALTNITGELKQNLTMELQQCLGFDDTMDTSLVTQLDLLTSDELTAIIDDVTSDYLSLSPKSFAQALNDSSIRKDILEQVNSTIAAKAQALYGDATDYVDELIDSAQQTVMTQINNAYEKAITGTIEKAKTTISKEYLRLSNKIEGMINKKIQSLIGSFIPTGLPILPPLGWWCTLNVWYIELEGDIPEFNVKDTHNEAVAHPLWGHVAKEYMRTDLDVKIDIDGDGTSEYPAGKNDPLEFAVNTGTFIIVPPGKTGVGDRSGGLEELSEFPEQ